MSAFTSFSAFIIIKLRGGFFLFFFFLFFSVTKSIRSFAFNTKFNAFHKVFKKWTAWSLISSKFGAFLETRSTAAENTFSVFRRHRAAGINNFFLHSFNQCPGIPAACSILVQNLEVPLFFGETSFFSFKGRYHANNVIHMTGTEKI